MAKCGGDFLPRRMHRETVEGIRQELLDLDDDKPGAMCSALGYLQQELPDLSAMCGTNLGVAAPDAGNGNDDSSCSAIAGGGFRKRKPEACLDAKSEQGQGDGYKIPRGKRQLSDLGEVAGKGKQERPKAGTKKKAEVASPPARQKTDYIHVRARRGQATDNHSLAERVRRERISERMRYLQDLVPGCSKVTGKAGMLDEIINYVQSLQNQVEFLSMKIAASNPVVSFDIIEDLFGRQLKRGCNPAAPPTVALLAGQLEPSCLQMSIMPQGHLPAGSSGFGLEMVVNSPYPPAPGRQIPPPPAGWSNASCFNVNGAAAAAVSDIGSQNLFSGFDAQFQPLESDCLLDNLKMEM